MVFPKFSCAAVLVALSGALGSYPMFGGGKPAAAYITGAQGASPAIQDNYITTSDGAQIHYLQAGVKTSAPAIVFIPGWTLSASLWRQELEKYAPTRLAIAVESRSQGESSKMLSGNTPESAREGPARACWQLAYRQIRHRRVVTGGARRGGIYPAIRNRLSCGHRLRG